MAQKEKIICVYKMTNIINNKFYIGSTIDFHKRKGHHIRVLKYNTHGNRHIQHSYNKYGNCFKFEILEILNTNNKEDIINREQYYLNHLNPDYNIKKIADSCLGVKRSKETCLKISKALTGKKLPYLLYEC